MGARASSPAAGVLSVLIKHCSVHYINLYAKYIHYNIIVGNVHTLDCIMYVYRTEGFSNGIAHVCVCVCV